MMMIMIMLLPGQGMMGNSMERGGGGAAGLLGGPRMTPPRPGMGPMSPGAYAAGMRGPPPQGPGEDLLRQYRDSAI